MSVLDISSDRNILDILLGNGDTGWADYQDTTTLTSASPLQLAADTDTQLTIAANVVRETQLPDDVAAFFANDKILGRNGDGIAITLEFKAKPTNAGTTLLEAWFDIGGSVGELYCRPISFPKGVNVERAVNFTVIGYTLDTWETNGAAIYLRANNTCDIYEPRVVITRTHRARAV